MKTKLLLSYFLYHNFNRFLSSYVCSVPSCNIKKPKFCLIIKIMIKLTYKNITLEIFIPFFFFESIKMYVVQLHKFFKQCKVELHWPDISEILKDKLIQVKIDLFSQKTSEIDFFAKTSHFTLIQNYIFIKDHILTSTSLASKSR